MSYPLNEAISVKAKYMNGASRATSLTVTVNVYAPDNSTIVSSASTTEIGSTGIYSYTINSGLITQEGIYLVEFYTATTSVDNQWASTSFQVKDDTEVVDDIDSLIDTAVTTLQTSIATTETNIETAIDTLESEIESDLATTQTAVIAAVNSTESDIISAVNSTESDIVSAISSGNTTVTTAISTSQTTVTGAISTSQTSVIAAVNSTETDIVTAINSTESDIITAINNATPDLSSVLDAIDESETTIIAEIDDVDAEVWAFPHRSVNFALASMAVLGQERYDNDQHLLMTRYTTFTFTIGEADLTGMEILWFAMKRNILDPDSESLIQMNSDDGLLILNGEEWDTSTDGSITFDDDSLTVLLKPAANGELNNGTGVYWEIKYKDATDVYGVFQSGLMTITNALTQEL